MYTLKIKSRGVMMAVAHKTVISFGLVAIPISLFTATQDNDIHFNQLHENDLERVKYKKVCGHCGKEVTTKDIIKGYQYDDNRYVVITDDDVEKIKTEKEKSLQIIHFAQLNQISPIYYEKTYQAVPELGGEKAFELLRAALMFEQKIAIGKTVMGTKDTLLAIIPREDGILVSKMFFQDEIKTLSKQYNKPEVSKVELDMAKKLINSMDIPFNPAAYKDEYQVKLKKLIETKIAGKDIVSPKEENFNNVINLMDALKESIEKVQDKPKSKKKRKKTS